MTASRIFKFSLWGGSIDPENLDSFINNYGIQELKLVVAEFGFADLEMQRLNGWIKFKHWILKGNSNFDFWIFSVDFGITTNALVFFFLCKFIENFAFSLTVTPGHRAHGNCLTEKKFHKK